MSDDEIWSTSTEIRVTLSDGSTFAGSPDDIALTPFGVERVLARTQDPSDDSEVAGRKVLYPWHRVAHLETTLQAATSHPGGQWAVSFGGASQDE
jgi:hypothetical protein